MATVEFFFDISSPWSYLGFHGIRNLCRGKDAELKLRPALVGGVFNTVNPSVYAARENPVPAKVAHDPKDRRDWARYYGVEIGNPPVFPVNSVKALRGCFLAEEQGSLEEFADAAFTAYWADLKDISQGDVMLQIADQVGITGFEEGITRQDIKDRLRTNTDELIARGGYGVPTSFVNETDMYFGNDRLLLVGEAIARL